jgi:hypothetical protein
VKQKIPKSLRSKLCKIKFMAFDADGVLFVNDAFHGLVIEGKSLKPVTRSHYDGQGITFLRSLGIRVCIITGSYGVDAEAKTELAERWNGLPSAKVGKLTPVEVFTDRDGPLKLVTLNAWLASTKGRSPNAPPWATTSAIRGCSRRYRSPLLRAVPSRVSRRSRRTSQSERVDEVPCAKSPI